MVLLANKRKVEHPDEAAVDQVHEVREGLPCRLFPGRPLDHEVIDGTKLDLRSAHKSPLSDAPTASGLRTKVDGPRPGADAHHPSGCFSPHTLFLSPLRVSAMVVLTKFTRIPHRGVVEHVHRIRSLIVVSSLMADLID